MTPIRIGVVATGVLATLLAPATAQAAVEQPPYTVLKTIGRVELRQYGPRLAAETVVRGDEASARNQGFRTVAAYIFGANRSGDKIAMTAPVAQSAAKSEKIAMTAPVAQLPDGAGAWRVQFFMPSKYTRATLPTPDDPAVRVVDVPAQQYAALRFSGLAGRSSVAARTAELNAAITAQGWRAIGPPMVWYYDPPWTLPPMRRNEVAVPVAAR